MRVHVLTALAVGSLLTAGPFLAADETKGPKSVKSLEGTWEVVSVTQDGKKVTPPGEGKLRFVVKDGEWSVKKGDDTVEKGTFKVDAKATPHTIDVTPTTGKHKGQVMHGIYEVNGDVARDCFALRPGQERPKGFAAEEGSGCRLTVYRRAKP